MSKSAKNPLPLPVTLLLSGAALRIFRAGYQSEWNDEALSVVIASGSVKEILTNQFHSLQPPGFYLLLHFWRRLVGDSETALRMLPVLFGILGVAAMFRLGTELFGRGAGLWAAALTAIMPFHLYYSQEIRSYSLLFLLAALALLCQAYLIRSAASRRWWSAYFLVALVGLYIHYLFSLMIAAVGATYAWRWIRQRPLAGWRQFLLVHLLLAIGYTPFLFLIQDQLGQANDYWIGAVTLSGFFSVPLSFTVGHFLGLAAAMVGYGAILTLLIFASLQGGRAFAQKHPDRGGLGLVLLAYWFPVVALYVVSLVWTPLAVPRLMMVAVPGLYLLLAWSAANTRERWVNSGLILLLLAIGLKADYNWLMDANFHKPPIRQVAGQFEQMVGPGEVIVYANDSGFRLFNRYLPDLDHRLYRDLSIIDNPQVRPEVIMLMGGELVYPQFTFNESFWLVLHQDFEVEEQEQILREFDGRYPRLSALTLSGVRFIHFGPAGN